MRVRLKKAEALGHSCMPQSDSRSSSPFGNLWPSSAFRPDMKHVICLISGVTAWSWFGEPGLAWAQAVVPPLPQGNGPTAALSPAELLTPSEISDGPILPSDGPVPDGPLQMGHGLLPHDLSPWGMFLGADLVVQTVMVGLAFASIVTWTVLLAKSLELAAASRRQRNALSAVNTARSLLDAARIAPQPRAPTSELVAAAQLEMELSADALHDRDGLKERIASRLERIEAAIGRRMTKGTGVLATIGATAPFVGLFGTVWGIMNSFIGISKSQTTNLAVVAPGIAEALLAAAIGLVAAIPAVVIYNHFARQIAAYKALVGDTSAAVLRLVSRDLSRGIRQDAGPYKVSE